MSLFNSSMSPADIAAVTGNCNNDGFGGNNAWWIILFLILAGNGWGNGYGGGGTNSEIQRSFDTASITNQLSGLANSVNNGFASAEIAACGRNTDSLIASYQNQIASMNQSFANAQALDSRLDNLSLQFQNCCCENRQNVADLKYTMAQESAATRANTDAKVQMVMDKLCALQIESLQNENSNLRAQLNEANRQASQTAQTSAILASQAAQTAAIENYIRPQANPAYVVPNPYANYNGYNYCGCNGQAV